MITPGPHGGDGTRLARALGIARHDVLDLSASLNPCAPDVAALVRRNADAITRYPDPTAATHELAAALGVARSNVLMTNGGAEAIALVARARPIGAVDEPDFSLYVRHLTHVERDGPRWRSNPHNPTGALAAPNDHAAVWDEAFYPLAAGTWTRGDADVIVVGSLTKVFACPGLRAGYIVADDVDEFRAQQPEWALNSLAAAILPELIARADLTMWQREIATLRNDLVALLASYDLRVEPSDANFVLVPDAPHLRDHLACAAVLVRDTASFGIPDGARIAVPNANDLDRLAIALKGYEHA